MKKKEQHEVVRGKKDGNEEGEDKGRLKELVSNIMQDVKRSIEAHGIQEARREDLKKKK